MPPPPALLGEATPVVAVAGVAAVVAAAAAAAVRLVGVDFGDPSRTEGFLLLFPRVRMGDLGSTEAAEGGAAGAARFTRGVSPPLTGLGGEPAPRLVGDLLGETGGFLGDAAAAAAAAAAADALRGGGIFDELSDLGDTAVRLGSRLLRFAAAEEERRVACRVGAEDGGEAAAGAPPPLASRASLMILNCRLISAVWDVGFGWWRARGGERDAEVRAK